MPRPSCLQQKNGYAPPDQKTGDSKAAQEARAGGVVSGWYSFLQADGRRRTVHYRADDQQGFRATVHQDKA
ncbi:Cuticle protein 19.8 [Eumeta japonica]|uniref:Cuticle protein 19.8 n=1 Tax=Eumeta variegata TaxID=151549 RepID=A0A4C1WR33_EUMVA|nr:Cuticle protein 19.8 [Eumeta japonica]